jgi:hypothetical protein
LQSLAKNTTPANPVAVQLLEGKIMHFITKSTLVLCAILFLTPGVAAKMKVDDAGISKIESIALVGYSFYRVVEMEPASPFKLKRGFVELTSDDPEFLMMQAASGRVIEVLQKTIDFDLAQQEDVFGNEQYQSLSKDPTKRMNLAWYFPGDFRDLKRSKANASKLAEALGVDAVLWVQFTHKESESTMTTLGAFGKKKKFIRLKGEVTLFDRSGNKLISGSVKSREILKSTRRAIGAVGEYASGIEIQTQKSVIAADDLWFPLLEDYLAKLEAGLVD